MQQVVVAAATAAAFTFAHRCRRRSLAAIEPPGLDSRDTRDGASEQQIAIAPPARRHARTKWEHTLPDFRR
jgi:hypothetical protein